MDKTKSAKGAIVKKVFSIISTIMLIAVLVLLAVVTIVKMSGGAPKLFGYSMYIVVTDSMTPEINIHDLVICKEVDNSEIKVGDDILFVSPDPDLKGMTIVHRVKSISPNGYFVTTGIKEGATEDKYPVTEILGKKVAQSALIGSIIAFVITNNTLFFVIFIAITLALIVSEMFSVIKLSKEKALENAKVEVLNELKDEENNEDK